jgi:ketosteroid isomerase-like protein
MDLMKFGLLPLAAFTILVGCSKSPPPDIDNRETALREIRTTEDAAIKAFGSRDAELSASFYATNSALMLTNMQIVKGSEVKGVLKELMADPNFSMKLVTEKVEASKSGDIGYTRGAYMLRVTDPKTKQIVSETGKYLTIYARQSDGSWKIVEDTSNPDAPATPVSSKK